MIDSTKIYYDHLEYDDLVEHLKWNYKMLNITKVKSTFIKSSQNICMLQDILLEKNKEYFEQHFKEEK